MSTPVKNKKQERSRKQRVSNLSEYELIPVTDVSSFVYHRVSNVEERWQRKEEKLNCGQI